MKRKRSKQQSRHARKRRRKLTVHVVDKHNDAMLPFLDNILEKGKLSQENGKLNKMLHFDSHPDLGNPEEGKTKLRRFSRGHIKPKEIHSITEIATWITPLVLGKHLHEVIWCAGSWCDQIPVGTFRLVVGLDKNGKMRTAGASDKNCKSLEYWAGDGCKGFREKLTQVREWTLHVVKFDKDGNLAEKDLEKIGRILENSNWVLDIDEDFYSCNNPYRDQFEASFGIGNWNVLRKIYDTAHECSKELRSILSWRKLKQKQSDFLKLKPVKTVIKSLNESGLNGRELLAKFQGFIAEAYEETKEVEKLISFQDLHEGGEMGCLPHHFTRIDRIVQMGAETRRLLESLTEPIFVTVATSRYDRYLPDCHASIVHNLVENILKDVYKKPIILRKDKPEFSVDY